MDRLWTPWRYNYVSGAGEGTAGTPSRRPARRGVPDELSAWPGDTGADAHPDCVFCNLTGSVRWATEQGGDTAEAREHAERAGLIVAQREHNFLCLNRYPYNSGHAMIVPYAHLDSLAKLPPAAAAEMIELAKELETALRTIYKPDGINLGMNLGEAAGAGVAEHLHLHQLPRWFGDTNFMTVTAETRVLPETLDITWHRLREALEGSR